MGRWWSEHSLRSVSVRREHPPRAFSGEDVPVQLHIQNQGWLPVGWLHLYDSLPPEMAAPNLVNQIVSLKPHGSTTIDYTLHAQKRGYYPLGPLFVSTGDLLGLNPEERRESDVEHFIVLPRIISFTKLKLPSRSPLGTLRHTQPIFEDPTRVLSKRDYIPGDSLRRVDWKATAITGRLQVKQFEPSIALETVIFLNMNGAEYPTNARIDATELAIVIAASLAHWVSSHKQTVGLITNGIDLLNPDQQPMPLPCRKGQPHLIRILELLARIQMGETSPLIDTLQQHSHHLPWGTTVVLITGKADETLFDEIFQLKRRGLDVVLIVSGRVPGSSEIKARADSFNIPLFLFQQESDLDIWRK